MSWSLCKNNEIKEIRQAYGETLEQLILSNSTIMVCDCDLASSSGAGFIYEKYPNHSVNFGISEQNMIAAGAGMSMVGIKPFVHSFAPFVSRRVADQVYMSLGFAQGNMHIYASDPGYFAQFNGATHSTFEDLALMRAIPKINVVAPSDASTFTWIMKHYATHGGIFYNRCTRKPLPRLYCENSTFEIGKSQWIRKGKDVAIIGVGASVHDALKAANELEKLGISTSVVDLFFVKPLDEELIQEVIHQHRLIVVVENHNRFGGVGEMIGCIMAKSDCTSRLKQVALNDRYGEVGTIEYLKEIYHLSEKDIVETVVEFFE